MTDQIIPTTVPNKYNQNLSGDLHYADSKDLVIVTHGFGCDKDHNLYVQICESSQKKGINAFRFNFSGYKPSEGEQELSCYTKQANDLSSVIDYFSKKSYRIKSIIGHSAGATAVIIQAAFDRWIESLILIAPRLKQTNSIIVKAIHENGKTLDDLIESSETVYPYRLEITDKKGEKSKAYFFSKQYLEELRDINIYRKVAQVEIPVLIVRGTKDSIISEEEVNELPQKENVIFAQIQGAGHTFKESVHRDELILKILNWYDYIEPLETQELDLLKINYQNLHESFWNNHKVSWTVTSIFIPVLFAVMGYLIKEYKSLTELQAGIGYSLTQSVLIICLFIMRIFAFYNETRRKKLKEIENRFNIMLRVTFFSQYNLNYKQKPNQFKFSPMIIYGIFFFIYTSLNSILFVGKLLSLY